MGIPNDFLELRLDRLSSSGKHQLTHLLKVLGMPGFELDSLETGGSLRLSPDAVKKLGTWMRDNPEHLMDWWAFVLERGVFQLVEMNHRMRPATEDQRRDLLFDFMDTSRKTGDVLSTHDVTLIKPGEEGHDERVPGLASPEQLLALIAAAGELGLPVAAPSADARTMSVNIHDGNITLRIDFHLNDATWKLELGKKVSAVRVPEQDSPYVPEVINKAWKLYRTLDPDCFENGLEGLFQEMLRVVKSWYKLGPLEEKA